MKALFIILVVLSMIFFIVKAVLSMWQRTKKDVYYNNKLIKYLNDYTLIGYIVLVYAFSISLYLADDYTIAECNFTLIILSIATALFVGEKVYFSVKNRGYLYVESNLYDFNSISELAEFNGVLQKETKSNFLLLDKDKFDENIALQEKADYAKLFKSRVIKISSSCALGVLLCIAILVVGLVRGV